MSSQEGEDWLPAEEDCLLAVVDSQPGVVDCWLGESDSTSVEADCSLVAVWRS